MKVVRLTKKFSFEMAHALHMYDGACKNIHGHSYGLEVCVHGKVTENPGDALDGFLVDFGDLKKLVQTEVVNEFDHALVLSEMASAELIEVVSEQFDKVVITDYNPTCENLISDFAVRIQNSLPVGVLLHHLKLFETATAFCEWYASDN